MKVAKQGVELEFNVIDPEKFFVRDQDLHSRMERKCDNVIDSRFYFDDSKPEYPSLPFESLPELEKHLSEVFLKVYDIAKEEHCLVSLLGNYPYFSDFASGHIHTSISPWDENAWLVMRRKLFNAQPIIALLSANSPIRFKEYIGSDVRLMLSSWASPVTYEENSSSHWMALAKGRHTPTLECRIPSSGPLFQILGIANLIRVLLENEDEELPVSNTLETWNRVIKYGSEAIVDVFLPKAVTYHGVKYRSVKVKASELWKCYLRSNEDLLKEHIKDCKLFKEIWNFYEGIANGVTMSDRVLALWNNTEGVEFAEAINEINFKSYALKNGVIESLPTPERKIVPVDIPMSFEEFKQMVESISLEVEVIDYDDIVRVLRDERKYYELKSLVEYIVTNRRARYDPRHDREFVDLGIFRENNGFLEPGENFNIVLQLMEE